MAIAARREDAPGDAPAPSAPVPPGWLLERDATGREALVRDRKGNAAGAWVFAGMASAIVLFALLLSREPSSAPPSPVASLIAMLLVAGFAGVLMLFAILLGFARVSIVPSGGIVETRLDLFGHATIRRVAVERLHVIRDTDGDNRNRYDLVALGEGRSLPLDSRRFDPEPILALARWLEARLGAPLDIDDDFRVAPRTPVRSDHAEVHAARRDRDIGPG